MAYNIPSLAGLVTFMFEYIFTYNSVQAEDAQNNAIQWHFARPPSTSIYAVSFMKDVFLLYLPVF